LGLTNVLFGRKKLKKAVQEQLFALSTARITLEAELGLKPSGSAAVVFKPMSAAEFVRAENELQELLDVAAKESASRIERRGDEFGYEWLIIHDNDFEELLPTVHLVASELVARGFGEQLLAAAFRFDGSDHPLYLIYGFKRGKFWPFIPKDGKERDNANELELKAKLEHELPIEEDLSRWFALFDAPI
jgi:PspA associated protein B